ncbi:MAG: hypothetical protein AMJ60_00160 [Desulfobacterales bacterium SG8_35]|nr:MAG: hypothetical protein AMJ60_00160 [Desulfobacterales bacterium SG8_35]
MKEKLSWFDRIMAAVSFAEANEHEVGREFLPGTGRTTEKKEKFEKCEAVLTSDLHGAELHS